MTRKNFSSIGVFDSGVGGLSVLDALYHEFSNEHFIYFGDTENMPYGSHTPAELTNLVSNALTWLQDCFSVKMIIIACNTASTVVIGGAVPLPKKLPVINPIEPTIQTVAKLPYRRVGLMATQATVESGVYEQLMHRANPAIEMVPVAGPGMAKMIEDGLSDTDQFDALLATHVAELIDRQVDAVILGCTHYPHVRHLIETKLPKEIAIIDPANCIVEAVRHQMGNVSREAHPESGTISYFVSGGPRRFVETADQLPLKHIHVYNVTPVTVFKTTSGK